MPAPNPLKSATVVSVALVIPVYNDWQSLIALIAEIDQQVERTPYELHVVIVDDSSTLAPDDGSLAGASSRVHSLARIRLATNLGHQRAIATGLTFVHEELEVDAVAIMDGDGEDKPSDLIRLLEVYSRQPDSIVVAERRNRSEGFVFASFYFAYRILFRILTGSSIRFGNFCVIPKRVLSALVHADSVWNHLGASIARLQHARTSVGTSRGTRYFGVSKMAFTRLVIHGLAAISVYADVIVTRATIISFAGMAACTFGILVVIYVRVATDLAIAGWATDALGLLAVLLLQNGLLALAATLLYLNGRSGQRFLPIRDSKIFIQECVWLRRQ